MVAKGGAYVEWDPVVGAVVATTCVGEWVKEGSSWMVYLTVHAGMGVFLNLAHG